MDSETLKMILKMIKEIEQKGYKVIKVTKSMEKDMDECVELEQKGETKECLGCSCSMCLMQGW